MIFPTDITKKEIRQGLAYLAFSLLLLPTLLGFFPFREGLLNCVYYTLNFAAVLVILRRFLGRSLLDALEAPFYTLYYAALGFLGYQALGELLMLVLPAVENANNSAITGMILLDPIPLTVCLVLLVPVAEECFYRGIIFRGLYDRSPVLAYLLSMAAFSAIHVVGYVMDYTPMQLLLCFIQYLPAGYCLCFAYRHGGSILSPIITHSIVNALGVYTAMR